MNIFSHIKTIDSCYLKIAELNERLNKPKSLIEGDKACNHNEKEIIREEVISLVEQIIKSKKAISFDYSNDSNFLESIKQLK